MRYSIDITRDLRRVGSGAGDLFCTFTEQWIGVGTWSAAYPASHTFARQILQSVAAGEDPYRWGIAIRNAGSTAPADFAGHVTAVGFSRGSNSGYNTDAVHLYGVNYWAPFSSSFSSPDPTVDVRTDAVTQWAKYVDGPWTSAEDAIVAILNANRGPGAIAHRRLPELVVPASQGRGPAASQVDRLPTTLDEVRRLAVLAGLTVSLQHTPGALTVAIDPRRTASGVRWSVPHTADGLVVTWSGAKVTRLTGAGSGDNVGRQFTAREVPPPPGGWAYERELVRDQSSGDTYSKLQESLRADLADRAEDTKVSASVTPAENAPYAYGKDYRVGDLTPVEVGRVVAPANGTVLSPISSATGTHTPNGWQVTPEIGPPGDPEALVKKLLAEIRRRGSV